MWREFLGSRPAVFESSAPIDESVSRLAAETTRIGLRWGSIDDEVLIGSVSREHVRLRRVRYVPGLGTAFSTIFLGHFVPRSNGTALVGRFTVMPFARAVQVGMWLFVAGWIALDLVRVRDLSLFALLFPQALLLLLLTGNLFATVARRRDDVGFITKAIQSALAVDDTAPRHG